MKGEELLNTWFAVRPRLANRELKASFLGRKMVALRALLLRVVARPVTYASYYIHHMVAPSAACYSNGAAIDTLSLSKVAAETTSCLPSCKLSSCRY